MSSTVPQSAPPHRDARRVLVEFTIQDLRLALRTLRKSWGFAATAILTLALGIGANTAIFQLLDAVRLRALPVANPSVLAGVRIKQGNAGVGISTADNETTLSYPLWEEIRRHQQIFTEIFAWANSGSASMGTGAQERRARGLWVSGEMFPILRVNALRGRVFNAEDDRPGCGSPGAVISYALWQSEFGGQDSAIGRTLIIQDRPTVVIGVTPRSFFGLEVGRNFDFAVPFCSLPVYFPGAETLSRSDFFWVRVVGRLKPGLTAQQASSQLDAASAGLIEATLPTGYNATAMDLYRKFRLAAYPAGNGLSVLRQTYDTSLWLLLGITALVLLIACANLANLMLVRASSREREMAVRLALGASRAHLIRQLLSEGLVLAAAGAFFGIALAGVFSRSLVRLLSTEGDPVLLDLSMDWRVLIFTGVTAIFTCVFFTLVPALRSSHADPGIVMKGAARGTTAGRERFSFQRLLVVSQIAVSVVLLVGASLFVRSFWNLVTLDPGFREKDILIAYLNFKHVNLPAQRFTAFIHDLLAQVRTMPEVQSAATSTHILLNGSSWNLGVHVESSEGSSKFTWVSPGFFATMEIPLLSGRDFDDSDAPASPRVAVVNETFVRKYLNRQNPLGKRVRTSAEPNYPETEYQIVGVIRDTKYGELRESTPPMAFAPAAQFPAVGPWSVLFIRFAARPQAAIAAVREKIQSINPEIGMEFHIFENDISNRLMRERVMALLSGFFGVLAVLLAMIGLYGVISYIVAMRRNEIGIRMALGASRSHVIGIVIRQTVTLVLAGVVTGTILALAAARGASSLLFGLQPHDPLSLLGASAFLAIVALIASYIPASRASRVDPMDALRYE